jgi:hypothetical protein
LGAFHVQILFVYSYAGVVLALVYFIPAQGAGQIGVLFHDFFKKSLNSEGKK